ncbi:MAG: IMP dehydrogenase [Thermotoga sp.]|nr:MAG: IMP dehydrogenase [Thermotoga sp.]HDM70165.1 IMP dehydrogenase [Thermotogales bacterium]
MFRETLTFDDVLLLPKFSDVLPSEVDLSSKLTPDLKLNLPFLSSAMDTVTESELAKAMAREGGIGIIHRNMPIEEQARQVSLVKRAENGVIEDPLTVTIDENVGCVKRLMKEYKIGGFPVVNEDGRLLGLITNRDVRFEKDEHRPVKDLMTPVDKLVTARPGITLDEARKILHERKVEKLPLVDENGILKGLITIKDIMSVMENPNASRDHKGRLLVGAAVGTGEDTFERVESLLKAGADVIVIDTAHGHSKRVIETVKAIRINFPNCRLIGGNVATAEGAEALIKAGCDAVKVGIGPGSICTTRMVAGVGVPQLSAIMDVVSITRRYGVPVIADGGIRSSGDIVKALGAGAHTVMMGNMFAGTEEAPGETVLYRGRKYKIYRGMGSMEAMRRGSADRYFQKAGEHLTPEGVEGMVPYRGNVKDVIRQLAGGLRAGMGYVGARNIEELHRKAEFIRITSASIRESHAHDLIITKEPPNYNPPASNGKNW